MPDTACNDIVYKVSKGEKLVIGSEKQVVKEEVKEEVKVVVKERTNFDLMLKGFSPESKIKIIKEVKNLMNLGLKESKDKVELSLTEPVLLYKNAPVEKANELFKFFKDLGADVELK